MSTVMGSGSIKQLMELVSIQGSLQGMLSGGDQLGKSSEGAQRPIAYQGWSGGEGPQSCTLRATVELREKNCGNCMARKAAGAVQKEAQSPYIIDNYIIFWLF